MVESVIRKSIPGRDANLPSFIVDRMVALNMRPTLTQLALGIGSPKTTLRENLNKSKAMKLETAVRIAEFLQCDLTDLVKHAELQ